MVDYAVDLVRATRPKEPGAPISSRTGWPGAPAPAPRRTSSWPPRPGPSSTAGSPSPPTTSAPSSYPCSATASSPTSTPTPKGSTSTRSSSGSSRPCASRRTGRLDPAATEPAGKARPQGQNRSNLGFVLRMGVPWAASSTYMQGIRLSLAFLHRSPRHGLRRLHPGKGSEAARYQCRAGRPVPGTRRGPGTRLARGTASSRHGASPPEREGEKRVHRGSYLLLPAATPSRSTPVSGSTSSASRA